MAPKLMILLFIYMFMNIVSYFLITTWFYLWPVLWTQKMRLTCSCIIVIILTAFRAYIGTIHIILKNIIKQLVDI